MDIEFRNKPTVRRSSRPVILALLSVAQFMVILDVSVVNVALPDMAAELRLTGTQLTWVATSYTVTLGGLLLLGGRLADVLGRRRVFLAGLLTFTAASAVAGLATGPVTILAARCVQGAGAALLSPAALAILTTTFTGAGRTRALTVWGAIGGGGAAAGVLVGGMLTSGPGWEWVFLVNVPVGLLAAALVPFVVPASGPGSSSRRLGIPGAALATIATGAMVFGLMRVAASDTRASALVALGASAMLWAAIVAVERRAAHPLVPRELLRRRAAMAGVATMLVGTALLVAAFFLGSLLMQRVFAMSALRTGLAFLPVAIATVAGAHLAGHFMTKAGPRIVGGIGFLVAGGGLALLAAAATGDSVWTVVVPGLAVAAVGTGATIVTATTTALSTVDDKMAGVASGTLNTAHEIGAAAGVALLSAVAGIGAGIMDLAGFTDAFWVASGLAVLAAIGVPLLLPRRIEVSGRPLLVH